MHKSSLAYHMLPSLLFLNGGEDFCYVPVSCQYSSYCFVNFIALSLLCQLYSSFRFVDGNYHTGGARLTLGEWSFPTVSYAIGLATRTGASTTFSHTHTTILHPSAPSYSIEVYSASLYTPFSFVFTQFLPQYLVEL